MNHLEENVSSAANQILDLIITRLKDEHGVRVENAIAAAATLAGYYLLKESKLDFSAFAPGSHILTNQVNEDGPRLVTLMQEFAVQFGLTPDSGWNGELKPEQTPTIAVLDLIKEFERDTTKILMDCNIPDDARAGLLAITAIRIVALSKDFLSEDIGKSIALSYMVAASKQVPL